MFSGGASPGVQALGDPLGAGWGGSSALGVLWAREALPGPDEWASLVSLVTPEWIPKLEL